MSLGVALAIEVVPLMGQDPKDVCRQACMLAHQLNVLVEFTMNGVSLAAGVFEKGEDLHAEYLKKIEAKLRVNMMIIVNGERPATVFTGEDPIAGVVAEAEAALRAGAKTVHISREKKAQ